MCPFFVCCLYCVCYSLVLGLRLGQRDLCNGTQTRVKVRVERDLPDRDKKAKDIDEEGSTGGRDDTAWERSLLAGSSRRR